MNLYKGLKYRGYSVTPLLIPTARDYATEQSAYVAALLEGTSMEKDRKMI